MELSKPQNIITLVLGLAVLVLLYSQFVGFSGNMSASKAAELSLNYINNDILMGSATATLAGEATEENGVYKFQIELNGQQFYSYVTKNGKMLFPEGIEMVVSTTTPENGGDTTSQGPTTCEEVSKTTSPRLEAFVVSYCPYGLQMQRVLSKLVETASDLAGDIRIEYIGAVVDGKVTSMHGDEEAQENLRQICLREEQPAKFYPYLECFMQAGDTEGCLTSTGVDKTKLTACETDPAKGVSYAQADFAASDAYGIGGSPTLILDGQKVSEFYFGGRTADAIKTILCCASQTQPNVCSTTLSQVEAADSFSLTYEDTTGSSSSASCE